MNQPQGPSEDEAVRKLVVPTPSSEEPDPDDPRTPTKTERDVAVPQGENPGTETPEPIRKLIVPEEE
jgi:hypothetical protein